MIEKKKEYDWREVEPSVAIIELITEFEHERGGQDDPTFLDPPLHTYVDTDALNTLVRSENTISIALEIARYTAQIRGSTIRIFSIKEELDG